MTNKQNSNLQIFISVANPWKLGPRGWTGPAAGSLWSAPKRSKVGDEVLFYVEAPVKSIIAKSRIMKISPSKNSRWSQAEVGKIERLEYPVPLWELRALFPGWAWLKTMRMFAYISPDRAKILLDRARRAPELSWIIKSRAKPKNGNSGWHWDSYFDWNDRSRLKVYKRWGGPEWIRNNASRMYIRDGFRRGDSVICYQADRQEIVGVTRLASNGLTHNGIPCEFDLIASKEGFKFTKPFSVKRWLDPKKRPAGFTDQIQGTVAPLNRTDIQKLISALENHLGKTESSRLKAWFKTGGSEHLLNSHTRPNAMINRKELTAMLEKLNDKFAKRDDVYVKDQINALIRKDGPIIQALKKYYKFKCQFPRCSARIPTRSGKLYCEVAHIRGVGQGGRAIRTNLLVLCPNHHKMLDHGDLQILGNTKEEVHLKLNGKPICLKW